MASHLQRSHDWFTEVFSAGICAKRNQVATIDMLLAHTAFALLGSGNAFALKPTSFTLLSRLAALKRGILPVTVASA